ncbi:MAG TPA: hypothetical protein DCM02_00375 [Flavobacterium sp.]|nr:hypothetical protein [Flavobacterium sp.]HAT75794.1 hypothetical protein [Flavobacterium sp.]
MTKANNILKIVILLLLSINLSANVVCSETIKHRFLHIENDSIVFSGEIKYFVDGEKSKGVQVVFITLDKVYFSNKTSKNGKYQIKIPSEKVLQENVILVEYPHPCFPFLSNYHIVNTNFSETKRCELLPNTLWNKKPTYTNGDDIVYVDGNEVPFNINNEFNKYPVQYVIEDEKIIKILCGETKKKRLILYYH